MYSWGNHSCAVERWRSSVPSTTGSSSRSMSGIAIATAMRCSLLGYVTVSYYTVGYGSVTRLSNPRVRLPSPEAEGPRDRVHLDLVEACARETSGKSLRVDDHHRVEQMRQAEQERDSAVGTDEHSPRPQHTMHFAEQ